MNHLVREVLVEVISGLLITEPHRIRKRGRRRRRRTTSSDQVLKGNRLFKCHEKETKPRKIEKRETKKHSKRIRHRKEENDQVQGVDFLGAMRRKLCREREKRETEKHSKRTRHRKEEKDEVQCMNKLRAKEIALWAKTQSKLQHSQDIISHTIPECMKHCYNARECNA